MRWHQGGRPMLDRRAFVAAALCAAGGLVGCSGAGGAQGQDGAPEQGSATEPQNVVALMRSLADMWLLAGGTLVGVTEDATDLDGVGSATTVGTDAKPSLEAIVGLDPGLVLLSGEIPAQVELRDSLDGQGVTTQAVTIESFGDYASVMAQLCAMTGRGDLYDQNVTTVQADIDEVRNQAGKLPQASYLALRTSAAKSKVLKDDHFACEILDDLALANIAEGTSSLDDLSLEAIAAADPDNVFVIYQGREDEAASAFEEGFSSQPMWQDLSATKTGHVYVLPKDLFQYKPNARWAEAYRYILDLREQG